MTHNSQSPFITAEQSDSSNNPSLQPHISLITICFNAQESISDTLKSVLSQEYKHIEYIIIDGASTDSTLTIIQSYKIQFENACIPLYISSEKDNGIYDAMNKGIKCARGEIIGFLNADDFFTSPQSLTHIANTFRKNQSDCVFGQVAFIDKYHTIRRTWSKNPYSPLAFFLGWHPAHPTFYVKRTILERFGIFNLNYPIAADYELMLRLLQKYKISSSYIPHCLVTMHLGGKSNGSVANILKANLECYQAWRENKLCIFPIFILLKPLRKILNAIFASISQNKTNSIKAGATTQT